MRFISRTKILGSTTRDIIGLRESAARFAESVESWNHEIVMPVADAAVCMVW